MSSQSNFLLPKRSNISQFVNSPKRQRFGKENESVNPTQFSFRNPHIQFDLNHSRTAQDLTQRDASISQEVSDE